MKSRLAAKEVKILIREDYAWLTETYISHRGLFDNLSVPENSLPAFERAAENRFAIETDVQSTKDGVLVVFHDDTLERMTGHKGKLCDMTFEQLRTLRLLDTQCVIPTFDEFLKAADGTNIVVEIKTHENIGETESKVYAALQNYKGNFCVESFNPFIVRWFKVHAPEVICGQLSCSFKGVFKGIKRWLLAELKFCRWNGSRFIAYDAATIATCKAVKRYAKKMPVICWTVKSAQQQQDLRQYYDNMIFDSYLPDRDDLRKMAGEPCLYSSDKEN